MNNSYMWLSGSDGQLNLFKSFLTKMVVREVLSICAGNI